MSLAVTFPDAILSMARDGGLLAIGLRDGCIVICNIGSGERVRRWKGHLEGVEALAFTSDGRLVSGSSDGFVKKWDVGDGAVISSREVGGEVFCLTESADGRLVVCAERTIRVLDAAMGREVFACRGHVLSLRRDRLLRGPMTGPFGCGRAMELWCGL
jgi:WD40 repeat protein